MKKKLFPLSLLFLILLGMPSNTYSFAIALKSAANKTAAQQSKQQKRNQKRKARLEKRMQKKIGKLKRKQPHEKNVGIGIFFLVLAILLTAVWTISLLLVIFFWNYEENDGCPSCVGWLAAGLGLITALYILAFKNLG